LIFYSRHQEISFKKEREQEQERDGGGKTMEKRGEKENIYENK